jgi:16S rRNA processing protein RimM
LADAPSPALRSDSQSRPATSRFIALGRLGRPHGLRGDIRLFAYSDGATLLDAPRLIVGRDWLDVERVRSTPECLIVKFRGVDSPEAAVALRHVEVGLPREDLPALGPGEFYWVDLIGLSCRSEARDFGQVVEVFEAGAHPILRARDAAGREELIPWVDAVVLAIEPEQGRILVDWAGLE